MVMPPPPPQTAQGYPIVSIAGSGGGGGGTIPTSGSPETGSSASGTVGAASAVIIAAGAYKGLVTVQNTSAANTLYISFNAAATTSDFAIAPGAAMTLTFGPTNALAGLGSAAGTTFALIGY
jgi:hypothetical protein